ncbi:DUF6065 family protein [Nocardia sp. SC052]|uniref:DUF6065 family protein n=1 Tax=Nocardia sichangensis TaxID=3385975 RepID=UPI0039A04CC0
MEASASFTMNWKFTRPMTPVCFALGEPICRRTQQQRHRAMGGRRRHVHDGRMRCTAANRSSDPRVLRRVDSFSDTAAWVAAASSSCGWIAQ